jgi:hypothetical protein
MGKISILRFALFKDSWVGWADGFIVCPREISLKSVGKQKDACPPYSAGSRTGRSALRYHKS